VLFSSGLQAKKLSKTNLAEMYSEYRFTRFDARIYHTSEQMSRVYLNISLQDFRYKKNRSGMYESKFRVAYGLYESYDSKSPVDSSWIVFSDTLFYGREMDMIVDFVVPAIFPNNYVLKVAVYDLNQAENYTYSFYNIQKTIKHSAQNFLITDENDYPLFGNFILAGNFFKVHSSDTLLKHMSMRYYSQSFPLAKPVFTVEKDKTYKFEPDSLFQVSFKSGISDVLRLPYCGIYHLQADTNEPDGLTIYRFDDGFPEVGSPAMAVASLRYLTTETEYRLLLSYQDYKIAVDSFWLERVSQQPQRAKKMIKRYYSRVQIVNELFTSFREGWKTDRGLVYILYGAPSEVYRKDGEEEWVYGERGNPMSIRFFFDEIKNPFTDNEFEMERSPSYKTSWMIAIENWRR
jgi:GWxTD domain-containing protein